jgi:hypothetical protein
MTQTTRLSTYHAYLHCRRLKSKLSFPSSLLIQKIQPSPFARRLLEVKFNPQLKNLFLSYKPLTCFILSSSLKGGVHSQIGTFIHVQVTNISITSKPQKNSDKNRIKQKNLTAQDWQLDSLKLRTGCCR